MLVLVPVMYLSHHLEDEGLAVLWMDEVVVVCPWMFPGHMGGNGGGLVGVALSTLSSDIPAFCLTSSIFEGAGKYIDHPFCIPFQGRNHLFYILRTVVGVHLDSLALPCQIYISYIGSSSISGWMVCLLGLFDDFLAWGFVVLVLFVPQAARCFFLQHGRG